MTVSNTKYLIKMLKKSKMTGKYSSGNSNKSDCISQECVITRQKGEDKIAIYNANHTAYLRLILNMENEIKDTITVDIDTLVGYLSNYKDEITLKVENNLLIGYDEEKRFSVPLLNRHECNDTVFHFMSKFQDLPFSAEKNKDGLKINDRTILKSFIKIDADKLSDAFKACESVGSSIYKIKWENNVLSVSSSKVMEMMSVNIDPIIEESFGEEFEVTISSPIHNLLSDVTGTVNLYGGKNKPLFLNVSNKIHYLIAPRVEGDA
tara:strand:+ start:7724 stop:8515 length:792 start_codon:yes stop_codon:yes gene_type:complete